MISNISINLKRIPNSLYLGLKSKGLNYNSPLLALGGSRRFRAIYRDRSDPKPRDEIKPVVEKYPLIPGPPKKKDVYTLLKEFRFNDAFKAATTQFVDPNKPGLDAFKTAFGRSNEEVKTDILNAYIEFNKSLATGDETKLKDHSTERSALHSSSLSLLRSQRNKKLYCELEFIDPKIDIIVFNPFKKHIHNRDLFIFQTLVKINSIQKQKYYRILNSYDNEPLKTIIEDKPFFEKENQNEEYIYLMYNFDPLIKDTKWKVLGLAEPYEITEFDKYKMKLEDNKDKTPSVQRIKAFERKIENLARPSYYEEKVMKREQSILNRFLDNNNNSTIPEWTKSIKMLEGYEKADPINIPKEEIIKKYIKTQNSPLSIERFTNISRATLFSKDIKEDKYQKEIIDIRNKFYKDNFNIDNNEVNNDVVDYKEYSIDNINKQLDLNEIEINEKELNDLKIKYNTALEYSQPEKLESKNKIKPYTYEHIEILKQMAKKRWLNKVKYIKENKPKRRVR